MPSTPRGTACSPGPVFVNDYRASVGRIASWCVGFHLRGSRMGDVETRRFSVVMRRESHLRLMERPGDDARRWNLNINHAVAGLIEISIFDEIEVRGEGVPVHVGVRVVVDRHSSDLDAAVAEAEHDAAVALALLSASARAPTDSRTLELAYEITPDV